MNVLAPSDAVGVGEGAGGDALPCECSSTAQSCLEVRFPTLGPLAGVFSMTLSPLNLPHFGVFLCPQCGQRMLSAGFPPMWEETGGNRCPAGLYSHGMGLYGSALALLGLLRCHGTSLTAPGVNPAPAWGKTPPCIPQSRSSSPQGCPAGAALLPASSPSGCSSQLRLKLSLVCVSWETWLFFSHRGAWEAGLGRAFPCGGERCSVDFPAAPCAERCGKGQQEKWHPTEVPVLHQAKPFNGITIIIRIIAVINITYRGLQIPRRRGCL